MCNTGHPKDIPEPIVNKYDLVAEYYRLADEVKAAETVIRGLKMMEQDEPQWTQPARAQGMEL